MDSKKINIIDPWESLRDFTTARIALGRAGESIPLSREMEFRLAHAHARDAVYSELHREAMIIAMEKFELPLLQLHSQASDRHQYLQRPDLGRMLNAKSSLMVSEYAAECDICIILADGLSATAINLHGSKLLEILIPLLKSGGFRLSPLCLAMQARVALGDPICSGLGATLSLMLIGERPGLSAADSIGAYLTYRPQPGFTDESRNCISNIRPGGLSLELAAAKIFYLVQEAFRRNLSGVALKDDEGLLE